MSPVAAKKVASLPGSMEPSRSPTPWSCAGMRVIAASAASRGQAEGGGLRGDVGEIALPGGVHVGEAGR